MSGKPSAPNPVERAELARLLAVPAERDLPGDQHRLLKEHLMRAIEPATAPAITPRARTRRRLLVGTAAAAMAVTAAVFAGLPDDSRRAPTASEQAVQLLNHIATVAARKPEVSVRDDQFAYTEIKMRFPLVAGKPLGSLLTERMWKSVNGSRDSLTERPDGWSVIGIPSPKREAYKSPKPNLDNPDYRYLTTLPTDPDELLKLFYADDSGSYEVRPDDVAFDHMGSMLEMNPVPPKLGAAIYQAMAKIPNVTLIKDETDAIGRHGVAIAYTSDNRRIEWIFDKRTYELLGSRAVSTADGPHAKKGDVDTITAITTRGVVDKPGQQPAQGSQPNSGEQGTT